VKLESIKLRTLANHRVAGQHDGRKQDKVFSMIRAWLDLPPAGIFASLALLYFGMLVILAVVTFRSPLTRPLQSLNGIVAPFYGSVAILFALLTSFLANDISERDRLALRSVQIEASELRNVHTLSVASVSDMRNIRAALKAYVTSTVSDEWPAMGAMRLSPRTTAAYDELLRQISQPGIARASGTAVHAALLSAAVRAGTARNDRLALATDHTSDLKWLVVIVLGLFTQVAIGLVHLERQRSFIAALVLFSCAVVVTLGTMALQEYPFDGALQLSPAPIQALQSLSD